MGQRLALGVAIVATGLFAGAGSAVSMLGLWLTGPAPLYAGYKQQSIQAYGVLLPALGLLSLLGVIAVVVLGRRDRGVLGPAVVALVAVVASIAITAAVHGPLNAEILGWSADAPPAQWAEVRDRWAVWQAVRFALAVVAFGMLAFLGVRRGAVSRA